MAKYRKKPVVVKAEQLTEENLDAVRKFVGSHAVGNSLTGIYLILRGCETFEVVGEYDWIIKESSGRYISIDHTTFEREYEKVGE